MTSESELTAGHLSAHTGWDRTSGKCCMFVQMIVSASQREWKSEYLHVCFSDIMRSTCYGIHKFVYDGLFGVQVCLELKMSRRTQLDVSMFWRCGHWPIMLQVFPFLPVSSHFHFIPRCAWQYYWFPTSQTFRPLPSSLPQAFSTCISLFGH